jgi:putative transposase
MARRSKNWQDRRCKRKPDDTDALARIHTVIGDLPTYGYRRVWALLRRQSESDDMAVINAKRVYRIMRQNALLLERKPAIPPSKRAHTGKVAVGKVTSGGALTASGSAVIMAKNCGSRSHWTVAIVKALHWAASNGGYDSETVQDVMLGAVERRFGSNLPASPVEWLTDNGSAYRSHQTRQFARMVGLEPKHTAVRSPQSNGMAESFVKTMKRD